jgi:LysR family transcriptional regulator, hydrogen peroxide-inducible genes activator
MNIKQLKFAYSLAKTGSFTVAANECCVTQPTLSNSIAQLEAELGEKLFKRSTRTVMMTDFGEHLLPYIKNVLDSESALIQQSRSYLKPDKQLIRIGISPLIDIHVMGLILEAFSRQYPEIEIVLREMNMEDLHQMLDNNQIDFIFIPAVAHNGLYQHTPLYEDSLLYIAKGNTPKNLVGKSSVSFKDIADELYVMVPDTCGLSHTTRLLFRSHRKHLQEYSGKAMSYQVLSEWASLGIGAAILPKSKLYDAKQSAFLIKDKNKKNVKIKFEARWHERSEKKNHIQLFSTHLETIAPKIIAGLDKDMI